MDNSPSIPTKKVPVGISACLLGEAVRYDGGHKLDRPLLDLLAEVATLVPICPESECGLGVPREVMQLAGDPAAPQLITLYSRRNLTETMRTWCHHRIARMEQEPIGGFIGKSRSPSCGIATVAVFRDGVKEGLGSGLFAHAFQEHFPSLPVIDEEKMKNTFLREEFMRRLWGE